MKTLIDLLRNAKGFRKTRLLLAAMGAIGLASCTQECTPIPINNSPQITSNPTTTQVDELSSYNYDVDATDPDGDKLTYSLPLAPPWLSIDSTTGMVSGTAPLVNLDTPFDIEVGVSEGINPVVTQSYTLTAKNVYLDVEGYLKDNETKSPQGGLVKIFNSANLVNPITIASADPVTGYFNFHSSTTKISDLSGVVLRAISKDASGNQNSYARTQAFPAGYVSVNPIMVVPYPSLTDGFSVQEFYDFMKQINISISDGLRKWNLNNLKGIEILTSNPDSTKPGSFSDPQQSYIMNKIKDPGNIEKFVIGKVLDNYIQIDINNNPPFGKQIHYGPTFTNGVDDGWIIVAPNNNLTGGQTFFAPNPSIINKVWIEIKPSSATDPSSPTDSPVVTHEFGHAFIARGGEAITMNPNYTIMLSSGNISPSIPKSADIKAAKIVYEDTYQAGEKLDDVLGTTF